MNLSAAERIVANSQDPNSQCAGGKSFADCATAQTLMRATDNFRPDRHLWVGDDAINQLHYFPLGCAACRSICVIARQMENGRPTNQAQIICTPPQATQ